MFVSLGGAQTWRLCKELYKFVWNIWTNNPSLRLAQIGFLSFFFFFFFFFVINLLQNVKLLTPFIAGIVSIKFFFALTAKTGKTENILGSGLTYKVRIVSNYSMSARWI